MTNSIRDYVQALPEIYQRIWGHPEYDKSSRGCEDRAIYIVQAVKDLQKMLGKKELRVLDLGCAQGYFCFTLRELGCQVSGIDFCRENIELCKALAEESGLDCSFKQEKLTKDFAQNISLDQYDVVLCLSVIHHVCNEYGFDYARNIFEMLSQKAVIVITELAVKEEPLYWNKNLPVNYENWFDNIAFFNELAFFPTHLSNIVRPLVIFSSKFFYCEKKYYKFSEWKKKSYDMKPEDNFRRYYRGRDLLMKFCHGREQLVNEIKNEVVFCTKNPDVEFLPKVLASESSSKSVLAVYKIKTGELLLDAIKNSENLDYEKIVNDILIQCIELEELGYYHGDLRVWNVCIKDDRAFLIDFGNIQKTKEDMVARLFNPNFNYTVYDAFMALVFDLVTKQNYHLLKDYGLYTVETYFDFSLLEPDFASFFKSFLLLSAEELSFKKLLFLYKETVLASKEKSFSPEQNLIINSRLIQRGFTKKVDFIELKKSEIDLQEKYAELERKLLEKERQIKLLSARLDSTYELLINTRHRTLYGALAWLYHKIFKRK
ncbi:MAG: methyltransferase domain-containing protein [Treponema sp.]|nr:methyltransferase domain-containing protein [Treponema sp.]